MTIQNIREVKGGKFFYRNGFRRTIWLLIVSLVINGILILGIYNKLVNKIEPHYYSTSGVKPPIQLSARSRPNNKPYALLKPDPETDPNESMLSQ